MVTTKGLGDEGEALALAYLLEQGMALVRRNYRVAAGPRRRGGEVDLIMRDRDGTLVFVEVRKRRGAGFGGAAGSVTWSKQRSIVLAAQHFLRSAASLPPCRFDVVTIESGRVQWLKAAFDAA